ncbi:hypothetical protein LTR70_000241 [Exophiala xenobiotica]|uniref:Uncharacterized protein n=1 Tax=Lithohypha guttulata TaxID=1690604 RepID=A0ABR0K431_9EURO|nr:hypothetical protein LTR24_007051 [Lithohypha guttulata]KAK5330919.1 hypothetical protein LTR70_000241 [Exophiala xenobiotica]
MSISSNPVRHTRPCTKAPTAPKTAGSKRLHDPVPASPITPTAVKSRDRDETDIIDAYGASPVTTGPSRGECNPDDEQLWISPPCPNPTRHPLHTYILPLLCASCQHARLQNIAHFEAQTIRESVEHEQAFGYNKNGVVDPERKKIVRNSGARRKGDLIPLICVEEARIVKENIPAAEDVSRPDTAAGGVVEQDDESRKLVAKMEQMNARIEATSVGSAVVVAADRDTSTDVEVRDSSPRQVSSPSETTTASSGWSWWGRGTASASLKATSPAPEKPQQGFGHKKTASRFSVGFPRPASPRVNVSRDGFGRNLKGMNRIMGWDGGGA